MRHFLSKAIILIIATFLTTTIVYSKDYYLSNAGNDSHSGTSAKQPWKTIQKLNSVQLQPGDNVYLNRGNEFMGEMVIKNSGTDKNPIVISAYGTGKLPVITGITEVSGWMSYQGKIMKAPFDKAVFVVYKDNQLQTNARFPNEGTYLHIKKTLKPEPYFIDDQLTQPDHYWEGSILRWRGNWLAGNAKVVSYADKKIGISHDDYEMKFEFAEAGGGYYFDNKFADLDTCNEWFYNADEKMLYYFTAGDIKNEKIKAVTAQNGLSVEKDVSNICMNNLHIEQFAGYGIVLQGNNTNIKISDCQINDIEGTGIHVNDNSKNCSLFRNSINRTTGRGIYAREPYSLTIQYNKVRNTMSAYGYGISGVHGMIGICITVHEVEKTEKDPTAKKCLISYNYVDSSGYIGIRCDGDHNIIENNVVKNSMLLLNDGAGIYGFAGYTHHNIIRNNIVAGCFGNTKDGPPGLDGNMARGIYLDNDVSYITVEGNTITDVSHAGIFINNGNHSDTVRNNTIYNTSFGIFLNEYDASTRILNNQFKQNIVFGINAKQKLVQLTDWTRSNTNGMASFSKNAYYNFNDTLLFRDASGAGTLEFNFKKWQSKSYDVDGICFDSRHLLNSCTKSKILYNETSETKTFELKDNEYYTLDGQNVSGSISIEPYKSKIVLFQ